MVKCIKQSPNCSISHLLFEDDFRVFAKGTQSTLSNLLNIFEIIKQNSDLEINKEKSKLYFSRPKRDCPVVQHVEPSCGTSDKLYRDSTPQSKTQKLPINPSLTLSRRRLIHGPVVSFQWQEDYNSSNLSSKPWQRIGFPPYPSHVWLLIQLKECYAISYGLAALPSGDSVWLHGIKSAPRNNWGWGGNQENIRYQQELHAEMALAHCKCSKLIMG